MLDLLESAETLSICYCLMLQKCVGTAGATIKPLYLKVFHVTCAAHLLYNRVIKVKSHFEEVNQVIAKVKSATVKNKTRQVKFATTILVALVSLLLRNGKLVKCSLILCKEFTCGQRDCEKF